MEPQRFPAGNWSALRRKIKSKPLDTHSSLKADRTPPVRETSLGNDYQSEGKLLCAFRKDPPHLVEALLTASALTISIVAYIVEVTSICHVWHTILDFLCWGARLDAESLVLCICF